MRCPPKQSTPPLPSSQPPSTSKQSQYPCERSPRPLDSNVQSTLRAQPLIWRTATRRFCFSQTRRFRVFELHAVFLVSFFVCSANERPSRTNLFLCLGRSCAPDDSCDEVHRFTRGARRNDSYSQLRTVFFELGSQAPCGNLCLPRGTAMAARTADDRQSSESSPPGTKLDGSVYVPASLITFVVYHRMVCLRDRNIAAGNSLHRRKPIQRSNKTLLSQAVANRRRCWEEISCSARSRTVLLIRSVSKLSALLGQPDADLKLCPRSAAKKAPCCTH